MHSELMINKCLLGKSGWLCLFLILSGVGCESVKEAKRQPEEMWLSEADFKACEAMARTAAMKDFPGVAISEQGNAIIELDDWQAVSLTVFIPVANTDDPAYLAYGFKSLKPYDDDALDVFYFAQQGSRKFEII